MKTLPLICAAALLTLSPASTAFTQEKKIVTQSSVSADITLTQQKQAQALFQEFDKKVMLGFKGDDTLRGAMIQDLKSIEAIKDPKQRLSAITAYQKKYGDDYRRILKKGGADLNAMATGLAGIFKGRKYMVVDGIYLVSTTTVETTPTEAPPPPPAPAVPTTGTINLTTNSFEFDSNPRCGGAAGASNSFNSLKLRSDIFSTLAGGCFNSAEADVRRVVASGTVEVITVKADIEVWALAIAVGGSSFAHSGSDLNIRGELPGVVTRSSITKEVDVFAPALWVAYAAADKQNFQTTQWASAGKTIGIDSFHSSYTLSIVTAGNSTGSEIRFDQAKIVVAPQ